MRCRVLTNSGSRSPGLRVQTCALSIRSDHDPQPLHAQMEELRPGELTWEYEVQGPYEFRIKVSWVASSDVCSSDQIGSRSATPACPDGRTTPRRADMGI